MGLLGDPLTGQHMVRLITTLTLLAMITACSHLGGRQIGTSVAPVKVSEAQFPVSYSDKQPFEELYAKAKGESIKLLADDLYLRASNHYLRGEFSEAAKYFEHLTAIYPNDRYVKRQYGVSLIGAGMIKESEKYFSSLYKSSDYKDSDIGLVLAGIYTATGDKKNARITYKSVLSSTPGHEEACIFLSKSYAQDKSYRKAHRLLKKCKKSKKAAIFSYYRGKIEVERQKDKSAIYHFRNALKIDPSYFQAAMGIGLLYEASGKNVKALSHYKHFLKKNPNNYSILSRVVYILSNNNYNEGVLPYLERLSIIDPDDLNLKVKIGIIYTDLAKYRDAKGVFKEILQVVPNSDKVLYYLGALYQQTDEFDDAIEYFAQIGDGSNLFADGNVQIGKMLAQMAMASVPDQQLEYRKKLEDFVREKSEKHGFLRVDLGVVLAGYYDNVGETHNSIAALERVKSEDSFSSDDKYFLALMYEKGDQFAQSRVVLEEIIRDEPDNADALNFLGYSLLDRGIDLDKSLVYIKKAVALKPNDGYIRDSLGWYYYKTGNYARALKELKKAWELVDNDMVITKHLALAYQQHGKQRLAEKFFNEALKLCTVESDRQEIMNAIEDLRGKRLPASAK